MNPVFKAPVTTNAKHSNQVYPAHAETYCFVEIITIDIEATA